MRTLPVAIRGLIEPGELGGRVVTVLPDGRTERVREPRHHSPGGFAWGYSGSGPADLAMALCAVALGVPPGAVHPSLYQTVKDDLIAPLDQEAPFELPWTRLLDAIARAKETA